MNVELISFERLEGKIHEVKSRLGHLWEYYENKYDVVLDVDAKSATDHSSNDESDDDDDDFYSISEFSYNSSSDALSQCSFTTALEYNLDLNEEDRPCLTGGATTISGSQSNDDDTCSSSMKKSVSFSNSDIIIHNESSTTGARSSMKESSRRQVKIIKGLKRRIFDYVNYEKFSVKYKWYKLKRQIRKLKHTNTKDSSTISSISEEASNATAAAAVKYERNTTGGNVVDSNKHPDMMIFVDLYVFFSNCFETFIIETDVDNNTRKLLYYQFPLQKTDFSYELAPKISEFDSANIYNSINNNNNNNNNSNNNRSDSTELTTLNLQQRMTELTEFENSQIVVSTADLLSTDSTLLMAGNILFQYLVNKARSPVEFKVAKSVVKLNLPLWYQNSLIG